MEITVSRIKLHAIESSTVSINSLIHAAEPFATVPQTTIVMTQRMILAPPENR